MDADKQPGWYPDPNGNQDLERYWDGVSWSATTRLNEQAKNKRAPGFTPEGKYDPQGKPASLQSWAPPSGEPVTVTLTRKQKMLQRKKMILPTVAITGMCLALVLTLTIWKPFKTVEQKRPSGVVASALPTAVPTVTPNSTTSPSPSDVSPSSTHTGNPTPSLTPDLPSTTPSGGSISNPCLATTGSTKPAQSSYMRGGGLRMEIPTGFNLELDDSQWGWLHEANVTGRQTETHMAAVAMGKLKEPIATAQLSTTMDNVLTCVTSIGLYKGAEVSLKYQAEASIGGKPGVAARNILLPAGSDEDLVIFDLFLVDLNDDGNLSAIATFCPVAETQACAAINEALDSVTQE